MTTKHKKRTPLIRRLSSIVAVFAIFILSIPSAYAYEASGNISVSISRGTSSSGAMNTGVKPTSGGSSSVTFTSTSPQTVGPFTAPTGTSYYCISDFTSDLASVSSNVGFYVSYYFQGGNGNFSGTGAVQSFTGKYINHQGEEGVVTTVDVDKFSSGASYSSDGYTLIGQFSASEAMPISQVSLVGDTSSATYSPFRASLSSTAQFNLRVTSARVIVADSSAELDAMQGIADAITSQTSVLSAFYGEIIALCNSIYLRCGDMETAIELTNQYCQQIIDKLNSIDSTLTDIYSLLGTQFALLISTIERESSNIQDAIANAELRLEAYFDAVGNGALANNPQFGTNVEDATGNADDVITGENEYESEASEKFADIVSNFNGFSSGVINGVGFATDLFTEVWNVLGEWKVVYTFPLIMGLILLVIGRMSRFSGTMNSRNNGDKDVGGD